MNITDFHTGHAQARPGHAAIEDGGRVISYVDLDTACNAAAANLQAAGIGPGDMVAVMLPDGADHLIILCALARAGAVIYSLSPAASKAGIAASLETLTVKAVIAETGAAWMAGLQRLRLADLTAVPACPFVPANINDDDPLLLVQTSATTGAAKFFLRSHAQTIEWSRRYAQCQGLSPVDRNLSLIGMAFHGGRSMSLTMLHAGGTVVIPRYRGMEEFTAQVQDGRITYLKLTPAHLGPLLDHAAGKGLLFPDLRLLSVTTAPVTAEQRGLARERLCANTVELFGTNETGVLMRASPVDQAAYPGALGRAVDGVEAGIVDADDAPVPTGEIGQLRFRGPGFVTNYLNAPEAAVAAFQDGWFYPGDLASMNGEGTVFYKGRADDMINNAGVKFYPIEVEAVLLSHPDITEAAVFGWPFPPHGEAAVACLVANRALSERELRRFCAKLIANHKIPHRFLVVPELPKNQMGKIQKTRLKELYGPRLPKPAP